jgi:hypothetical protein
MMWRAKSESYIVYGQVGRLVDARVLALNTGLEARTYCQAFLAAVAQMPSDLIICADYRAVPVFRPDVADELKKLMTGLNDRVLRSSILIHPSHATGAMQAARIAAETGHGARRSFTEPSELLAWISTVTTAEELRRATSFLAEWRPGYVIP